MFTGAEIGYYLGRQILRGLIGLVVVVFLFGLAVGYFFFKGPSNEQHETPSPVRFGFADGNTEHKQRATNEPVTTPAETTTPTETGSRPQ